MKNVLLFLSLWWFVDSIRMFLVLFSFSFWNRFYLEFGRTPRPSSAPEDVRWAWNEARRPHESGQKSWPGDRPPSRGQERRVRKNQGPKWVRSRRTSRRSRVERPVGAGPRTVDLLRSEPWLPRTATGPEIRCPWPGPGLAVVLGLCSLELLPPPSWAREPNNNSFFSLSSSQRFENKGLKHLRGVWVQNNQKKGKKAIEEGRAIIERLMKK